MILTSGLHPIRVVATRPDGATNTFDGNINIGNDVFVQLGSITNTQTLFPLIGDQVVSLNTINKTQTVYGITEVVEQIDVVEQLGTITHTQTIHPLVGESNGMATILSSTPMNMGSPFTITANTDLTAFSALSLTLNGVSLGTATNIAGSTATFNAPSQGLAPKQNYDLILGVTA